jgi:ribosomal protein S18 acetylase RimI-like enzyme
LLPGESFKPKNARADEFAISNDSALSNEELNALFAAAWPHHAPRDFQPVLVRSLAYVVVRARGLLVGFVNVAWDGGDHAFLLDPTVHPEFRRRGIGTMLLARAEELARARGAEWLHADFEPHLEPFYRKGGFQGTFADLVRLKSPGTSRSV